MNGELLEVVFRDGEYEVTVRKAKGKDPDISGNYIEFDSSETYEHEGAKLTVKTSEEYGTLILISYGKYVYSLDAPSGFRADSAEYFISEIIG